MDEPITISVCPNGCHASLTADVEVTQKREVDCEGNTIDMLDSDAPSLIDFENLECKACHADAVDVDCRKYKVYIPSQEDKNVSTPIGVLYLPVEESAYAYYLANGDNAPQRLDIHCTGTGSSEYVVIEGVCYFIEADGVFPDTPLEGQQSLF